MSVLKNTQPSTNGRKRPQLTDSISRLDSILDGLADAIPATVADSIREALAVAVRESVQAALTEAFTNPEVLAALAARLPAAQPEPTSTPMEAKPEQAKPSALRTGWNQALSWAGEKLHDTWSWCGQQLTYLQMGLRVAWHLRGSISLGLAAGGTIGLLAYLAGPMLAAILSGLLTSVLTMAGVLLVPLVRMLAGTGRN